MKVFILNDQPEHYEGIKTLLRQIDRHTSFTQATNWIQVERALKFGLPDLLILDWHLSGIEPCAVTELIRTYPGLRVAIFTQDLVALDVISLLRAGILGILPCNLNPRHIVRALELILWGGQYIHPSALHASLSSDLQSTENRTSMAAKNLSRPPYGSSVRGISRLSPRQHEIMRFLHMGSTNKMVARALDISEGTVKIHLGTIYKLLGATNRASAVALYNNWQFERKKAEEDHPPTNTNITENKQIAWNTFGRQHHNPSAKTFSHDPLDATAKNDGKQYIAAQKLPTYSSDLPPPPLINTEDPETEDTKGS